MAIPTKEKLAEEMMRKDWNELSPTMRQIAINRHFLRLRCLLEDKHLTEYVYHSYVEPMKHYICNALPNYKVTDETLSQCQVELENLEDEHKLTWKRYGAASWPKLRAQ